MLLYLFNFLRFHKTLVVEKEADLTIWLPSTGQTIEILAISLCAAANMNCGSRAVIQMCTIVRKITLKYNESPMTSLKRGLNLCKISG